MRKNITLVLLLGLSIFSYAQQDPAAKEILDKLSENIKSYKTIKAEFTYNLENVMENISESYSGNILIKGKMYKLFLMNSTVFFNGTTMWSYMEEEKEVNITEPEEDDDFLLSNPSDLFTIYDKDFKYKLLGEKNIDGKTFYEIDLFPYDLEKDFFRIRILINASKDKIKSFKVFSKDGNRYIIDITKFTPNTSLDDNTFTFNEKEHPDVEVIDLRW